MGEAMLFSAMCDSKGMVALGPLSIEPRINVRPGSVKVAVRPQAWQIVDQHIGLKVQLKKSAYLGSGHEYTFGTELGDIFVIQNSTINPLQIGQSVGLVLDASGVSVVEG
jgi:iron(III) transport system ATP-binding protein